MSSMTGALTFNVQALQQYLKVTAETLDETYALCLTVEPLLYRYSTGPCFAPLHTRLPTMSEIRTPYAPLENSLRGARPHIYVNGFCFCFHHGEEFCNPCTLDFRALNNVTIQDDLEDENMARNLSDHRSSIKVYSKGSVAT
ncbi:hypothetical protein M413DRAFT_423142 [Hebeloma cylindrosporum]|uniref:Uncharacterized protein n=1 Tax=Hebeloma cylindrosporum TaxID=76867 RepID=A0A0C3CTC7_HEBCY|nr:hypothetical protein M413DRAFT_423142 [Hebeloma cylindrosporum h7]